MPLRLEKPSTNQCTADAMPASSSNGGCKRYEVVRISWTASSVSAFRSSSSRCISGPEAARWINAAQTKNQPTTREFLTVEWEKANDGDQQRNKKFLRSRQVRSQLREHIRKRWSKTPRLRRRSRRMRRVPAADRKSNVIQSPEP